ncbi:MAG TPA: hypothetical protein VLM75_15450 [Spirochaetota bacterium]|nr:hypothetical protein [Spirochaetota bacterium]
MRFENVFIIADIEGSSGCRDYSVSSFLAGSWPGACLDMTRDIAAVTDALLAAGMKNVTVLYPNNHEGMKTETAETAFDAGSGRA